MDAVVTCTPRSGRPGAENEKPAAKRTSDPEITVVETIVGGKRDSQSFVGPGRPPEPRKPAGDREETRRQ